MKKSELFKLLKTAQELIIKQERGSDYFLLLQFSIKKIIEELNEKRRKSEQKKKKKHLKKLVVLKSITDKLNEWTKE